MMEEASEPYRRCWISQGSPGINCDLFASCAARAARFSIASAAALIFLGSAPWSATPLLLQSPPFVNSSNVSSCMSESSSKPYVIAWASVFFAANLAMMLSLPPVLRGKGAPYLPTWSKSMDVMFRELRKHVRDSKAGTTGRSVHSPTDPQPNISPRIGQSLTFVDLGSGDGRVVFRAAQEGMFTHCVGYEINPMLHWWATARRMLPRRGCPTEFHRQDLWTVDLQEADVVAVVRLSFTCSGGRAAISRFISMVSAQS